jgi:hypothetical protein
LDLHGLGLILHVSCIIYLWHDCQSYT